MSLIFQILTFLTGIFAVSSVLAMDKVTPPESGWIGGIILIVFAVAYTFVLLEEKLQLRKSKPVTIGAGLIWILVMLAYNSEGRGEAGVALLKQNVLEYAELMLFLLSAMTFVNAVEERGLFNALKTKLVNKGLSLRSMYWVCGLLAFFLSPIADNLTTALILGGVSLAVGKDSPRFIFASCVNVVVAANAGGVFSPFGDITTLMVWQKGVVDFWSFFHLFIPALISWAIPAFILSLTIPNDKQKHSRKKIVVRRGGYVIALLFLFTIALTVTLHNTLHIPPFLGMMTGLGFLKLYGFFIRRKEIHIHMEEMGNKRSVPFDIFVSLKKIEWDTLFFFYGIILCVGGLGALGYLVAVSEVFYVQFGETLTHVLVGIGSALIGNVPATYAMLSMNQVLSQGQWLLLTLTAGIGGSLLSIGSAAGVALMGQAHGTYTFGTHLKWTWAILLGYLAGVGSHLLINAGMF